MPRRSKDEVARRARLVFDDYHDGKLAVREIAADRGVSIHQVYRDVAWWWSHHQEFEGQKAKPPKKVKRKQTYDELWELDPDELRRMLNIIGVDGVAFQFGCSRYTVWRAIRGKGLRRGDDGKYVYQPPNPENPDEVDAFRKMIDVTPRRGPSIVVIDAQVGQRTRAPSLWCDHEWETLVYEAPIPGLSRRVIRCRYCRGTKSP